MWHDYIAALANLLVRQFENERGRKLWEKKDNSARLKRVEASIRMVGVLEMVEMRGWLPVYGSLNELHLPLERALALIRRGEERLTLNKLSYWRHPRNILRFVQGIADELMMNSTLLCLEINSDFIGPEVARHLSAILRRNSTLLCLNVGCDFRSNQIGDEGACYLSDALRENSTLLYLVIAGNMIGPQGARHLSDMLKENSTLIYLNIGKNNIGPEGACHILDGLKANSTLLHLNIGGNGINDDKIETEIKDQMILRCSFCPPSDLRYEECRSFLRSSLSIQSWTSIRVDYLPHPIHDQLPPEMWGEILAFLSNDIYVLRESILVPDLRSGFFFPVPICSFSSRETCLLSMIPLIEGLFRYDLWTKERLSRFGFHGLYDTENNRMPEIDNEKVDDDLNRDDERDGDSSHIFPLKRAKTL